MTENHNQNQSNSGWRKRQIALYIEAKKDDFELRGKLATLKCWHRLTQAEQEDLLRFAAAQPAQKKPQNCGTGYCSCIECLIDQKN